MVYAYGAVGNVRSHGHIRVGGQSEERADNQERKRPLLTYVVPGEKVVL